MNQADNPYIQTHIQVANMCKLMGDNSRQFTAV